MKDALIQAIKLYIDTPLHFSASSGHTGVVGLLFSKGASIQARNQYSMTPLHLATGCGHTGVVELLLSKGALIEALDSRNKTPLHRASWSGYTGVVELLHPNRDSMTPLHHAERSGSVGVWSYFVRELLQFHVYDTNLWHRTWMDGFRISQKQRHDTGEAEAEAE